MGHRTRGWCRCSMERVAAGTRWYATPPIPSHRLSGTVLNMTRLRSASFEDTPFILIALARFLNQPALIFFSRRVFLLREGGCSKLFIVFYSPYIRDYKAVCLSEKLANIVVTSLSINLLSSGYTLESILYLRYRGRCSASFTRQNSRDPCG